MTQKRRFLCSGRGHGHELRRLMADNYSIFYYIKGADVIVTDILYSKSDIERHWEGFDEMQDF